MDTKYVLDSYAVLCYLQDEPEAGKVFELLQQARMGKAELFITWVNMGEVYYRVWREYSKLEAERVLDVLLAWPLNVLEADSELTIKAAAVKAENRLAYADAFAIGAALLKSAVLVTGDPEIREASGKIDFKLYWLRKSSDLLP